MNVLEIALLVSAACGIVFLTAGPALKHMNKLTMIVLAVTCATGAQAAGFYGSLTVDGQLPRTPVGMQLICAGQTLGAATADRRGSYEFGVDRPARDCVVRVENATATVVLYANPTRYDFALTHSGGTAQLTRR